MSRNLVVIRSYLIWSLLFLSLSSHRFNQRWAWREMRGHAPSKTIMIVEDWAQQSWETFCAQRWLRWVYVSPTPRLISPVVAVRCPALVILRASESTCSMWRFRFWRCFAWIHSLKGYVRMYIIGKIILFISMPLYVFTTFEFLLYCCCCEMPIHVQYFLRISTTCHSFMFLLNVSDTKLNRFCLRYKL